MSKFGMDLGHFKKIKSDKNTTTLKHKDGHEIKISHESVGPKLRSQLAALPHFDDGGGVQSPQPDASPSPSDPYKAAGQSLVKNPKESPGAKAVMNAFAKGGPTGPMNPKLAESKKQPPMYAEGTPDAPVPPMTVEPIDQNDEDAQPDAVGQAALDNRASPEQYDQQAASQNAAPAVPINPAPQSDNIPGTQDNRQPAETPQAPPQDQPQAAAPDTGAPAQPALLPLDPDAAAQPADQQQAYQAEKNAHKQEFIKQNVAFSQDLANGHITPETYKDLFDKKDTLGKIGTIFGLMVSGAGAGLTHQPNALMKMMNQQITNDLEAQKQNKTNAQNLVSLMNTHELQKSQAGLMSAQTDTAKYNLQRMAANNIALTKLAADTSKLDPNSPQGKAAQTTLGMLYNSVNAENYNLADRAASAEAFAKVMGLNGAAPGQDSETAFQQKTSLLKSGMMGPQGIDRAKDMEAKHVPGFAGQASQDLNPTTKKELGNMVQYDQQLQRYTNWAKQHSGVLPTSPENLAIINQGKTLAKALQSTYREASLNTVYRPGEQGLLSETIPDDPTKFLNKWRVIPQLDALRNENQAKLNVAGHLEGLGAYQGFGNQQQGQQAASAPAGLNPQQQAILDYAKAHPENPKSAQWIKKLGAQ